MAVQETPLQPDTVSAGTAIAREEGVGRLLNWQYAAAPWCCLRLTHVTHVAAAHCSDLYKNNLKQYVENKYVQESTGFKPLAEIINGRAAMLVSIAWLRIHMPDRHCTGFPAFAHCKLLQGAVHDTCCWARRG